MSPPPCYHLSSSFCFPTPPDLLFGAADNTLTSCRFSFCVCFCPLAPLQRVTTPLPSGTLQRGKKMERTGLRSPAAISKLWTCGCTRCACGVPAQPTKTLSLATTTSISLGTAPYNYKTNFVALGSFTPVWIYFFTPPPFAKCYVLLSRHRCSARSITPFELGIVFVFGQGGALFQNSRFFLRRARVRVKTANQEKEPTMRTHLAGQQ